MGREQREESSESRLPYFITLHENIRRQSSMKLEKLP